MTTITCPTCGDRETITVRGDECEPCPDCTSGIEGRCRACGDILNGHDAATLCLPCRSQSAE